MIDLYCLFNRARGIELVSPGDLLASAQLFETVGAPYNFKKFDSGSTFIMSSNMTDDMMIEKVMKRLKDATNGLSAAHFSHLEQISIVLAKEHLLLAESKGLICRDDTIQGLLFYINLFH